jgi:hypothetical protein
MKNASLLSLALLNLLASCYDVRLLSTSFFPLGYFVSTLFVISFVAVGTCLDFTTEDC